MGSSIWGEIVFVHDGCFVPSGLVFGEDTDYVGKGVVERGVEGERGVSAAMAMRSMVSLG